MEKIEIADLGVNVLDEKEQGRLVELIRGEMNKRKDWMKKIWFKGKSRNYDGFETFMGAQQFEEQLPNYPIEQVRDLTKEFIYNMEVLMNQDPTYYEFHYINGKNLLVSLNLLEPIIIQNRASVKDDAQLAELNEHILWGYPKSQEYFREAIRAYDDLMKEKGEPVLQAYKTNIESYLGSALRSQSFFIIRTQDKSDLFSPANLSKPIELNLEAIRIYDNAFKNGVFQDMRAVGIGMQKMANSLKMIATPENIIRGLLYYRIAGEILGDHPQISEGIEFFETLMQKL
jgi:hypothetical protein